MPVTVELVLLSRVAFRGVAITGSRLPELLALLAADPAVGCSTARLVDALWPDEQPDHPTKALQVLVSRARARLGPDTIASTPLGYRLTLTDEQIDAAAVQAHATASERLARAGDHTAALERADAGLALCAGAANWDDGADPLARLRAARVATYRSLCRSRALALARLGRCADALGPLTGLVHEQPRDEELLAELLRCEAAVVGPAAALARYDAYRRALRDDLGSDPGPALRAVHADLLRDDQPTVRRGVRHEPNPLLGRDADVAAVTALLRSARVTSIVGPGGLGKTRLAHVVSRAAQQRTVHFVALAGVPTDADVVGEVVSVLGVGEHRRGAVGPSAEPANVVAALGPGPALLVLDNCEHVVRGVAELVQALVSASPDLRVLTTSRAPLGLSSESVYSLPELSLATSVELFEQRARAARPGVDLPPATVRELCAQLDGLPLAVELAAARVRVLSVADIARRIDDRFALLRGGARDAPERHRTLHAVIDWSWRLLDADARAALAALSVFPGGFGAAAARHMIGAEDVLEQLVDQSLLQVADTESGTRFRMLETVREFGAAHRGDDVIDRFLAWARDFGVARAESLFTYDLIPFTADARTEQDNLVQALRYGLDRADGATVAATSAVLGGLWIIESNFARVTGRNDEIARVLARYRPAPELVDVTRTALVLSAVGAFLIQGTQPLRLLAALRRFPAAPPESPSGAIQTVLCRLHSVAVLCDSADPLVAGMANCVVSYLLEAGNDLDGALVAARRTLAVFEGWASPWLAAIAHARVGELSLHTDPGDALRHMRVALAAVAKLGAWTSVARARWAIALAGLQHGDIDDTEAMLVEAASADPSEGAGLPAFDVAVRAEIQLARGEVDAGLAGWRRAARQLEADESVWPVEARAVCVVAHAQHDRLSISCRTSRRRCPGSWRA